MRVKLLDGVVFDLDLEVTDDTMVDELKRMIAEHESGAPVERQRVIFRGKVLKEGHKLTEYGIASDSTVHLVTRPEAATNPPQTEPMPGPEHIPPATMGAGGVFMSTVNIGDGETLPDFNDIVNRMLTSIPGVNAASTMASSAPSQTLATISAVDSIRQQLNYVAHALSSNEAVNDLTLSNDVPSVAQTTAQLRELCSALIVLMNQVQNVLQRPSLATDPDTRASTERICGQLAQALCMLGPAIQQLGGILAQTRLGSAPGQEQIQLPTAGVTVAIHVPESDSGPVPSDPSISQPIMLNNPASISQTFALNGPLPLRARRTTTRSGSNERSSDRNRSVPQTTAINSTQNRPDISAMLNSVASMLGGPIRASQPVQIRSSSPPHPNRTSTSPSRTSQASGSPMRPNQASSSPSGPNARSTQPPSSSYQPNSYRDPSSSFAPNAMNLPQSTAENGSQRPPGLPSDLFQMLAPMVSSMLGAYSNGSVNSLASFMSSENIADSESNRFDILLSSVMSRLQLSDLLAMFGGDWSCLEPIRGNIRASIVENFMHGNDTPDGRIHVVNEATDYVISFIEDESVIDPVRSSLRPGIDISSESRRILRPHIEHCIAFILDNVTPFASELKRLLTIAIGHWIDVASSWFIDGIASVEVMLKRLVQSRVESFGPEFAILGSFSSGIVTSILMHCRAQYQEASGATSTDQQQWMQELPLAVAMEWRRTIEADVARQSTMPPQPPLSNIYNSLGSGNT